MSFLIHFILVALGAMVGYDLLRRMLPATIPGVIARAVIAGVAVVLWIFCPVPILVGLGAAGLSAIVGPWMALEPVSQMRNRARKDAKVISLEDIGREVHPKNREPLARIPVL